MSKISAEMFYSSLIIFGKINFIFIAFSLKSFLPVLCSSSRFFSFPLSRKALFIGVIPLFEITIRYYKIKSVIKYPYR